MKLFVPIFLAISICSSLSVAALRSGTVSQKSQDMQKANSRKTPDALRKQESDKNFQRDRQMILQKKNELEGKTISALPSETEKKLYAEMVAAYERNDELSFQSRFQRMMMDYPKGVYADESLYYAGMLAFSNKLYGRALKHFDQVLTQYPRSNRSRAALYAKAAAYRKMNLKNQAVSVYKEVETRFPGSPEARRASIDLKIVK